LKFVLFLNQYFLGSEGTISGKKKLQNMEQRKSQLPNFQQKLIELTNGKTIALQYTMKQFHRQMISK